MTTTPALRTAAAATAAALVVALLALVQGSPAGAASTTIKVATYNVCAEKCGDLEAWRTRSAKVAASIAYQKPDVVLVQEAGTADYHAAILTRALKARGYIKAQGLKARYIYYRASTMSRVSGRGATLAGGLAKITGRTGSKLQYFPYQLLRRQGTSSYTLFVNMHLTVGYTENGEVLDDVRLGEVSKMYAAMSAREKAYPTIFGGDLNSLSEDADPSTERCGQWQNRWRVDQYLQSKGYLDSIFEATTLGTPPIGTVNADPERVDSQCKGRQIDHLYTDERLEATTWRTNHVVRAYEDQYSDHDMVVATFTR